MPTFKLNGNDIPFEPGDTIMRAAWRQGIEIPHYCWHPGLSVAANCRMCLVHITSGRQMAMPIMKYDAKKDALVPDTKPKLMPACQMEAQEGMEVTSQSEDVKQAQAAVQEFLLLNHPVDCPICDQAGECKLQDYWAEHQHSMKRKRTEPVHKPKGVRFGPTIIYDAERCISCTRCIRVCDELVGDHVLDSRERGNRTEITLAPGRELDHDYTLMTEHVCPVGALTSRDFRFKARVWFLKSKNSICNGCASGCNSHADYDPRYNKVYRLRPRDNEAVNKFWMCDRGMMSYKECTDERIFGYEEGRGSMRLPSMGQAVLDRIVGGIQGRNIAKVAFVLSATASTEENLALVKLGQKLGIDNWFYTERPSKDWKADGILRSGDNNPNRAGMLKVAPDGIKPIADLSSDFELVLALHQDAPLSDEELLTLNAIDEVIVLASNHGELTKIASAIVPIAAHLEMSGSFINENGLAQSFERAVPAPGGIHASYEVLAKIASELGFEKLIDAAPQKLRTEALKLSQASA